MTTKLMDVAEIRFTQEHVYDTFNANSDRAGSVLDLMDSILKGEKTPWDIPLIRVAAKKGAYWCVDNRRLFTYKHLQLGTIPVEVFSWKDNREFELKYKNGLPFRQQTSNGLRIGLLQRSGRPFPRSPVAEPTLSKFTKFFTPAQQRKHEAQIAALRKKRDKEARSCSDAVSTAATALEDLLQGGTTGPEETPKKRKRKLKKAMSDTNRASSAKKKPKSSVEAADHGDKVTVTVAKEDSDDEEFDVEITAPL
ncbi:unnamed protein product [Symbiodinium pilosum]|uniref:Uncharacterized protein n=1 Tax=Symbiodinium pilosum TaxID=2952 RepID=A0A812Q008_SYMPI|nr:unnamed protein product [Symbiodinium pilosum]